MRLVEICCTAAGESGDALAWATSLSELVLLVPNDALRCTLHQELVTLRDTETVAQANPKPAALSTEEPCAPQVAAVPNRKGPFARRREAAAAKLKQPELNTHKPA